ESQAVLDFVRERILTAAGPKTARGGLGPDVTLRAAIEAAVPFVEENFKNQPLIEARLRMTLGYAYLQSQDSGAAIVQYERAAALFTSQRGDQHRDTLACLDRLADAYRLAGRLEEAVELGERLLSLCRAKLAPGDSVTLEAMENLGL